jgi:predicted pyridoxine 5'-phosphate oxidase superfamily flavin-nucleotide-binding protein
MGERGGLRYHEGMRHYQDRFDTRRLADRMEEVNCESELTEEQQAYIASRHFFFLATADASGWPECSYKGGMPGWVRAADSRTVVFPSYDGNGMFRSMGNLRVNPKVGLLFIDFENPKRLRINGVASLHDEDPLLGEFPGAQFLVRVRVEQIFRNCPRYIPKMKLVEESVYAPRPDYVPPVPEWKTRVQFCDVLPGVKK